MLARDAEGKASSGTPREAAQDADAVLLAVHWSRINDVLNQAGDLSGKVVITYCLPMNDNDTELVVAHTFVGCGGTRKEDSQSEGSARIQHCAQRSAFQRLRSQAQG